MKLAHAISGMVFLSLLRGKCPVALDHLLNWACALKSKDRDPSRTHLLLVKKRISCHIQLLTGSLGVESVLWAFFPGGPLSLTTHSFSLKISWSEPTFQERWFCSFASTVLCLHIYEMVMSSLQHFSDENYFSFWVVFLCHELRVVCLSVCLSIE